MNYILQSFDITIHNNGNTIVRVNGRKVFLQILIEAFPQFHHGPIWEDRRRIYDYGVFFNNIEENDRQQIQIFLKMLQGHIYLDDNLHYTFALDYHYHPPYEHKTGRTDIGECVFQIKYRSNTSKLEELTTYFETFIRTNPLYSKADYIVPVPYFGDKAFDLPTYITKKLSGAFNKEDISPIIRKVKETKPMKDMSKMEKFDNISDCFEVSDTSVVQNKTIIIVDDLYHTGTTLAELGQTISKAGAKVLGLVATKTWRSSSWD